MTELSSHLNSIKSSLNDARTALTTSDSFSGTEDGISLLTLKSHLLLSYLQHVTFYILLKLNGERIDEGKFTAVVDNLIDLRVYLDKGVKPIEAKLRYQIDKVIRAAERVDRESQLQDLDNDARDALAYKPNPQSLVVDEPEDKASDGIYRPPRIASTLPARELTKRRRAPNNTLRDFVDSELSAAPISEPSIGSNIRSQGRQSNSTILSSRERASQAERDRYEEENYTRLPTLGKAKKRRRNEDIYGGEDFRVLDEELYGFDKGPKLSLAERSRKRAQEDRDEEINGGDRSFAVGEKFQKRQKGLPNRRTR